MSLFTKSVNLVPLDEGFVEFIVELDSSLRSFLEGLGEDCHIIGSNIGYKSTVKNNLTTQICQQNIQNLVDLESSSESEKDLLEQCFKILRANQ